MSEASSAKDDKSHGDDKGHGAKKETVVTKVWKAAGITLGVVIGVIVLIYLLKATFPMISQNLIELIQSVNQGLLQVGVQLSMTGVALRSFFSGILTIVLVVLFGVLLAFLSGMLVKKIREEFSKGGGDKDHH